MKKQPLFIQTMAALMIIILLTILPMTFFNIRTFRDFYFAETESGLLEAGSLLANLLQSSPPADSGTMAETVKNAAAGTDLRITVTDYDGKVIADSHNDPSMMNNHADRSEIAAAIKGRTGTAVRNSATLAYGMMYVAVPGSGTDYIIRTAKPLDDMDDRLADINNSILLLFFILLVVSAAASLAIAKRFSSLLGRIRTVTARYARGDFSSILSIDKPAELLLLSEDLNRMGSQLRDRIATIEKQNNELELILDNISDPVVFADSGLHAERMNRAAEEVFGISEELAKGRTLLEIFRNTELIRFAEELLEHNGSRSSFITLEMPRRIHIEAHGTVVPENGNDKLLLVLHDITKMKQLEEMRKDFVANVSHELKTPITLIKGYVETLLDASETTGGRTREFLGIVEKHSARLEAIIDDLLLLSGIEKSGTGKLERERIPAADLLSSAAACCSRNAAGKNIAIETDCADDLFIDVHPMLAEQAVFNLIDNAVKYSDPGTAVKVSAEAGTDGRVCIEVRDQGPGIAEEHLERIFERFYRADKARSRDSGGTGLGLSIVRHIALSHNGSITVESRPGRGSVFRLCL